MKVQKWFSVLVEVNCKIVLYIANFLLRPSSPRLKYVDHVDIVAKKWVGLFIHLLSKTQLWKKGDGGGG